jgi:hypothetical protein
MSTEDSAQGLARSSRVRPVSSTIPALRTPLPVTARRVGPRPDGRVRTPVRRPMAASQAYQRTPAVRPADGDRALSILSRAAAITTTWGPLPPSQASGTPAASDQRLEKLPGFGLVLFGESRRFQEGG